MLSLIAWGIVSTENVSHSAPLKLAPFIMNTDARSNTLSKVHSSVSSPVKNSSQLTGGVLLVRISEFGPYFSYLLSMTSKNMSVHSLLNVHLPTSSMIKHAGFTRELTTFAGLPSSSALSILSLSSDAFR